MFIKLNCPRIQFTVSFILLLTLCACGLLGPNSKIDESLDANDLVLLLDDLGRDFEAEDTDDLEDLLEELLDDFTGDFEGRTDIEAFSYGIPHQFENVLGFTIEIKDPADWVIYDEKIEEFEDDFIKEFLDLAEVSNDYDSNEFDLSFGDTSAAYTIEYEDVTTDIFTFRRDRFAYIVAHIYVSDPDADADDIAETLDERLLELYGEDDPHLDENKDLEITITTNLAWLFLGESGPDYYNDVAVEEPIPEEPVEEVPEPTVESTEEPVEVLPEPTIEPTEEAVPEETVEEIPEPTEEPAEDTSPTSEPQTTILFQDDFSRTSSGWDRAEYEFASTDYGDDVYRIEITSDDYFAWATPYLDFVDVVIEVETFKASGGDDNGFGIVCRHEDEENFYFLEISSDGYTWIGKYNQAEYDVIDSRESSNVNLGSAANNLRAECIGNELSLYVNGELELRVYDSDFTSGDVGVIAETYTSTSTEILFDNFIVTQP